MSLRGKWSWHPPARRNNGAASPEKELGNGQKIQDVTDLPTQVPGARRGPRRRPGGWSVIHDRDGGPREDQLSARLDRLRPPRSLLRGAGEGLLPPTRPR